jgi:2-polyprenyl-3-methyl-5-hydroxy-6-metoxy-1,4-benzoquinol methylase
MKPTDFERVEQPGGCVSASPLPSPAALREFYAELYYQTPQSTTYQSTYGNLDHRYKALKCEALLHALAELGMSPGDEFLDVGAGEGFLMDAADRHGLTVTGLDYSSFAIEKFFPHLRPRLLSGDVIDALNGLAAAGRRVAVCSVLNVLEHVLDPSQLLASVRNVLAPRGLAVITVPNDYSRLHALLREEGMIDRDFWWAPPQHLHYFNAENLRGFCVARGFEVVDGFSDFPIDLYLLHPGSNYVLNPQNGPAAHRARLLHDLLIAQQGLGAYLDVYRALFKVGAGRNITLILRQADDQR